MKVLPAKNTHQFFEAHMTRSVFQRKFAETSFETIVFNFKLDWGSNCACSENGGNGGNGVEAMEMEVMLEEMAEIVQMERRMKQ